MLVKLMHFSKCEVATVFNREDCWKVEGCSKRKLSGLKLIITEVHNKIPANSQQQQKKKKKLLVIYVSEIYLPKNFFWGRWELNLQSISVILASWRIIGHISRMWVKWIRFLSDWFLFNFLLEANSPEVLITLFSDVQCPWITDAYGCLWISVMILF